MIRTPNRALRLSGALAGICTLAAVAHADAPVSYCPRGAVTVYFASGAATATPQVEALMGKIGDTAASCQADRIDLLAHIDPSVDGEGAAAVALERLKLLMKDLVARGLPVDRIRFGVTEGEPTGHFSQVDVVFRKAEIAGDVSPSSILRGDPI